MGQKRPILGQKGPFWAKNGPKLPKIGQKYPKTGQLGVARVKNGLPDPKNSRSAPAPTPYTRSPPAPTPVPGPPPCSNPRTRSPPAPTPEPVPPLLQPRSGSPPAPTSGEGGGAGLISSVPPCSNLRLPAAVDFLVINQSGKLTLVPIKGYYLNNQILLSLKIMRRLSHPYKLSLGLDLKNVPSLS